MTGAWTMTDEGEFVLNEPYATHMKEAKRAATNAWRAGIYEYLADHSEYDVDFLDSEFLRRAQEDVEPLEIVDEFIIEALEGNL